MTTLRCTRCGQFTNKLLIGGEWTRVCVCTLPERRTPIPMPKRQNRSIPRWQQVANLRATGMTFAAIARELHITKQAASYAWQRAQKKGAA